MHSITTYAALFLLLSLAGCGCSGDSGLTATSSTQPVACRGAWLFEGSGAGFATENAVLYGFDLDTGEKEVIPFETTGNVSVVNAIGFNEGDGRIYGLNVVTQIFGGSNPPMVHMARITVDRVPALIEPFDVPYALGSPAPGFGVAVGDVSSNGIYHLWDGGNVGYWIVDVNPTSATYLSQASFVAVAAGASTTLSEASIGDWAFAPNGNLYALSQAPGGATAPHLWEINPTTNVMTDLGATGITLADPAGSWGAHWIDGANLVGLHNTSDEVWQVDITNPLTTLMRSTDVSPTGGPVQQDGAFCAGN